MKGARCWLPVHLSIEHQSGIERTRDVLGVETDRKARDGSIEGSHVGECCNAPHVRPFEARGRRMGGFVVVGSPGIAEDDDLARWVDAGAEFAATLPPK